MASENESLKVGDEVEIIGPSASGLKARIGQTGFVRELNADGNLYVLNSVGTCMGIIYSKSSIRRIPPAQAEPLKKWVPENGSEADLLIRVKVVRINDQGLALVAAVDEYEWLTSAAVQVHLSQLRPLPVVQGEGVVS